MCCKPSPPPAALFNVGWCWLWRGGYRLSGLSSLTDFSVDRNKEQTGVRQ